MLVPPGDDEHDCGWKTYAKAQESKLAEQSAKLDELTAQMAEMQRRLFGKKSERRKTSKLPPPLPTTSTAAAAAKKRADAHALRDTKLVPIAVPADQRSCPECEAPELRLLDIGDTEGVENTCGRRLPRFAEAVDQPKEVAPLLGRHRPRVAGHCVFWCIVAPSLTDGARVASSSATSSASSSRQTLPTLTASRRARAIARVSAMRSMVRHDSPIGVQRGSRRRAR